MKQKLQSGFVNVLILVGILIITVIAGGAYYLGRQTYQQPTQAPVTSQPPQPISTSDFTTNWETYTNRRYNFELKHPQEWLLTSNISEPFIPDKRPLYVENLYNQRVSPEGPVSVVFSIAVYEKSPEISLAEWLSKEIQEVKRAKNRSINEILEMAYSGELGIFSYYGYQEEDIAIVKLGGVIIKGSLSYAAYLTKPGFKYVYVIDLHFPYYENLSNQDEGYLLLFDQILSTFKFMN